MSRLRTYPIDGNRLKALIIAQGRTLQDASELIGGSRDYLTSICRQGRATAQCMSLIGLALSIPKDLYEIKEPEPEAPGQPDPGDPEDLMAVLKNIQKLLNKVVILMEEEKDEQKTWRLPFGDDPGDSRSSDDNPGINGD